MKVKEPDIVVDQYQSSIIKLLSWYSYEKTKDDAKDYLLEYIKREYPTRYEIISRIPPSNLVPTYGFIARLLLRGLKDKKSKGTLDSYIENLKFEKKEEEVTLRKYEKPEYDINDFLGSLDEKIDDFIINSKPFNINTEIKKRSVPSKFMKDVESWSKTQIDFLENEWDIVETCEDGKIPYTVKERVYPNWFKSSSVTKLISFLTIEKTKKKITRKRKIDPHKQVSNVKYQKEHLELSLTSVHPIHIIGAKLCIIYNTKYNVMSIFKANSVDGLFVKGSSIYNFIETTDKKKIKKPEKMLTEFLQCDKSKLMEKFDLINTKDSKLSGQLNENTLILRVEK